MVGLKYRGKKIPFIYEGENIVCGKMMWGERGQVIKVPREDAELLSSTSPTDFKMILKGYEEIDEPIEVIEKDEPEPEPEPEDEEVNELACTHEGCDFVAKKLFGLEMHTKRKHPKIITPVVEAE